jgi:lysophospholipase L1-like esterase
MGVYTITADVAEGQNYLATVVPLGDFVIEDGYITDTAVINNTDLIYDLPQTVIYNGAAKSVNVTARMEGTGAITVKYNGDIAFPVNAGEYEITVDVEASAIFKKATGLLLDTLTVAKADVSQNYLQWSSCDTVSYDGVQHSVVVEYIQGLTVSGLGEITVLYNGDTTEPVEAGIYVISVDIDEGQNFNSILFVLDTLVIKTDHTVTGPWAVTLKVIDQSKGAITNKINDHNETNIFCWVSDNLKAQNPRTPDDWWYPMYNDAGCTPTGLLVKTETAWEWTITLNADTGTYEWSPNAKTLGWQPVNPNMYGYVGDNGNNLIFRVGEGGVVTGHNELVIPDPNVLPRFDVTLQVVDMTKGVLTDAPGTWAYDANIITWVSGGLNDSPYWFYGMFGRSNVDWNGAGNDFVTFPRGELIKNDTAWIWQATFSATEGNYSWNPMSILAGWSSLNNVTGDAHWDGENMNFAVSETGDVSGQYQLVINYPKPDSMLIRVSCIGNSNTEGAGASNASQYAWPVQLRAKLTPEYTTANHGVSGATLMNLPDPWGAWTNNVNGKFELFKQYNANIVLVALGTNDSKDEYWNMRGNGFKDEYINFLDTVYKYSASDAEIYMIAPIFNIGGFGINNNNILNGVIPAIREISQEKGIQVIDWYSISKNWTTAEMPDGTHANDAALGRMAQKVADIMLTKKPFIAINDNSYNISDDDYAAYRWYKDDVLLENFTGKQCNAVEAGTYKLAVRLDVATDDIIISNKIVVNDAPQTLILAKRAEQSVNIEPQAKKSVFSVSPNPVNDKLYIIDSRSGVTYRLLDIRGNILQTTTQKTVNVSHLSSGMYMINAEGKTVKFIKK